MKQEKSRWRQSRKSKEKKSVRQSEGAKEMR